jgi:hypothetical protein
MGNIIILNPTDLTVIDNEPRVQDLRLADALGFDRLRNIRKLIAKHAKALEKWGLLRLEQTSPSASGGRPSKAYWLNERQALYITAKSDTETAADVTVAMVEVFAQWRAGTLQPKAVAVKGHTRRTPRSFPPLPPIIQDGIGVLRVNGEFIVFDTCAFDVADGTEVLGVHAGSLIVTRVKRDPANTYDDHDYRHRCGWLPTRTGRYETDMKRAEVRIIGRVLGRAPKELVLPGGRGDYYFLKNIGLNNDVHVLAGEVRELRQTVRALIGRAA